MKPVNLLPAELRPRVPGEGDPRIAWGVLAGLAVLLVLVVVSISLSNKAKTLNDEATALRAEADRRQATVALVPTKLDEISEQVRGRTLLVGGLSAVRFPWNVAMHDLSTSLPPDVTLDTINAVSATPVDATNPAAVAAAGGAANQPTMLLTGCAGSWVGYSRFLSWLRQMPGVGAVTSTSSSIVDPEPAQEGKPDLKKNCGPQPLSFGLTVAYAPKKADLLGLPKPEDTPAGATGATTTTPSAEPAAATTGG